MIELLKIPLIALVTVCCQITWTAPNKARKDERLPVKRFGEKIIEWEVSATKLIKTVWWSLGVLELSAIVLKALPKAETNGNLVEAIFPIGDTSNLSVTPSSVIGFALILFGTYLRYSSYQTLGKLYTYQLSIRTKHRLITSGPYQYIRHPGYVALTLVELGLWVWHLGPGSYLRESGLLDTKLGRDLFGVFWIFLTSSLAGIWICRVPREEKELKKNFGKEYEEWKERVRYRAIPGLI